MCRISTGKQGEKREREKPFESVGQKRSKVSPFEPDVNDIVDLQRIGQAPNPQQAAPKLKRSLSQRRLVRSNSEIDLKKRRNQNKNDDSQAFDVDHSVIGVFSREASRNFARNYEKMVKGDPFSRATASSKKATTATSDEQRRFIERQSINTVGSDLDEQMKLLFENKLVPHVIAIVEGKEEKDQISFKKSLGENDVLLGYTKILHVDGTNKLQHADKKQNMTIYVRDDMKEVYTANKVQVKRNGKIIDTVGIDYKTENGEKFRTLVVHIPNEFVGNDTLDKETHNAFLDYAKEARKTESVHVTSYIGDTNYKKPITPNSVPSMGGIMSDNTSLNSQSSSAKNETNFMQHVSLKTEEDQPFVAKQPSTLNQLLTNNESKVAMDHPSLMGYTSHNSPLKRNPSALMGYYE